MSKKPASMGSLLLRKGGAQPAADATQQGDAVGSPSPGLHNASVVEEVGATRESPKPVSPVAEPSRTATPIPASPTGGMTELTEMLAVLHGKGATDAQVVQASKVMLSLKLSADTERKLKRLVGFERMRRMSNFSQQDYLESRLTAIIDLEYSKLPALD